MDNKYGRLFTTADVVKILEWAEMGDENRLDRLIKEMDKEGVAFQFEPDEPLFTLRGHDRRAIGAIRFYQDHQAVLAPQGHIDAIQTALGSFYRYREANPDKLKDPD